jgi:hypothetical protein
MIGPGKDAARGQNIAPGGQKPIERRNNERKRGWGSKKGERQTKQEQQGQEIAMPSQPEA